MAKRLKSLKLTLSDIKKRVIGCHKWMIVPGYDLHNVWDEPATYVIYLDGELSYVGQSNTPRFRFSQHGFKNYGDTYLTPWGEFKDMYVKMKYSKKYGMEAMLEKRLIRRLNPRFNIYKFKVRKRERM